MLEATLYKIITRQMLAALWGKPEVHCHAVVKHCACMLNNMNYIKFGAQFKGAIRCLRSRLSIFVYIRNVLVIYVHGISYTVY